MSLLVDEIKRISWSTLRDCVGFATKVPDALAELLFAESEETAWKAYWKLDNHVILQGTLYQSAEFIIPFLIEFLLIGDDHVKRLSLELLFQICNGESSSSEDILGNSNLKENCLSKTREGIGIFYFLLKSPNHEIRTDIVELLPLIEKDESRLIWYLKKLQESDPIDSVRESSQKILANLQSNPREK